MGTRGERMARIVAMLLSYIVGELDAELDRLHNLRTIVSSLGTPLALPATLPAVLLPLSDGGTPLPVEAAAEVVVTAEASIPAPPFAEAAPVLDSQPREPRRVRAVRGSRGPRKAPSQPQVPTAFSTPSQPKVVVVSAKELEQERATRATSHNGTRPAHSGTQPAQNAAQRHGTHDVVLGEEIAPDALARSLAAKWLSGTNGAAQL